MRPPGEPWRLQEACGEEMLDAEVSREDGEPCQRHLHPCSQSREVVSWESLQPDFTIGVKSRNLGWARQDWGLHPPGPPTSVGFFPPRAAAPVWGLPAQLSSPGSAGHCSCLFRPKGCTAFPLLLRAPHVTQGCSNSFMASPDLFIVPFCQLPSAFRTKVPFSR